MPKFSKNERERIHLALLTEGERLFTEKGFSNVTAEEIAATVGIAKGTFYHFFQNKEHLFMEINNLLQEQIFSIIQTRLPTSTQTQNEQFYSILLEVIQEFLQHPMILEVDSNVWTRLEEKVPKECLLKNDQQDQRFVQLIESLGFSFAYDIPTVTQLLQLQFTQLSTLRSHPQKEPLIKITLKALSEHLIKEEIQ